MAESGTQTDPTADAPATEEFVPRLRRLVLAYLGFATGFSVLVGAASALQMALSSLRLGLIEVAPRMTLLSLVRDEGPAVSVSAAAFALVVWSHAFHEPIVRHARFEAFVTMTLASTLGVAAVITLATCVSALVYRFGFDVSWHALSESTSAVLGEDLMSSTRAFGFDACPFGVVMWFALPYLTRTSWSVSKKLVATWVGGFVLRNVFGMVIALLFIAR